MKFKEYMKIRGGKALTSLEIKVLGIEYSKGWRERYADLELSSVQINRLISLSSRSDRVSDKNKLRLQRFQPVFDIVEDKFVYLMLSSAKSKIGISKDPIKRARHLTTLSGEVVEVACVWKVTDAARSVEAHLHRIFKKVRLEGEWFNLSGFNYLDIEKNIYCPFERVFINEEVFRGRNMFK